MLPHAPLWAERADALLAHRGPDGSGHYVDQRCELVHRRLALIDRSPAGRQPMANEDCNVQVVCNGEIYNHGDLRRELQARGHTFRSSCDVEVLVHLYEEEGDAMVERLRGIFAFALYDARRRSLLLARDRFGVKPLFYTRLDNQWVFASEMKAICALPGFQPRIDRQACYDFLGLGYVPEPATGFANIAALPIGTTLRVSPDLHRVVRYYRAGARPEQLHSLHDAEHTLEDRLLDAVAQQSCADVPVAALLSGGIDSSLIVAAHGKATGNETSTFSVRVPVKGHDESVLARSVAEHCHTDHHSIEPGQRSLSADAILPLLRHFDQPFADTSLIPMSWVSNAVRENGVICALSGDGGDEAFGGYARFWRANTLTRMMRAPAWALRAARFAGRMMTKRTRDLGRQLNKAVLLADAGRDETAQLLNGLSSYLSEEQKAELVAPQARDHLLSGARLFDSNDPPGTMELEEVSRRMTESLFAVSLPSDMLRKVDMMSMRAGIEVRVPMLDQDVVAFGLTLPHRLKTNGHTGKLVPRKLASRWLPPRVSTGRKHGFTVPLDALVPADFHDALYDLLCWPDARTRPFVNGRLVRRWLTEFRTAQTRRGGGEISRAGLYQRVMMLLALELWMRDYALTW